MNIRNFRSGDEQAQVAVYNAAAGALPKFKPASLGDVQRRTRAADFDPGTRFYAEDAGQVVGYCIAESTGRISYPWALVGHEAVQQPLFEAALASLQGRNVSRTLAAYRGDWPAINSFFVQHGFHHARDMVNFVLPFADMPTAGRPNSQIAPVAPDDIPALLALMPNVLAVHSAKALRSYVFDNPYFGADALFVVRSKQDGAPVAVGILIANPAYANPEAVDASMPCFRLGAFGTEGQHTKRLCGLFSFLVRGDQNLPALGMDLLGHAIARCADSDATCLAAQAPSDVPALLAFYQGAFRKQGSFPVHERAI